MRTKNKGTIMPHIVKTSAKEIKFPELCAFCEKRKADSAIVGKYTKATGLFPLPVFTVFTWQEQKTGYPACGRCAKLEKVLKIISMVLIVVPWIVYMFAFLFLWPSEKLILYTAIFLSIVGLGALLYRQWLILKFRIGYVGSEGTFFYSRSKKYADNFAKINGLESEYKLIFLRFW